MTMEVETIVAVSLMMAVFSAVAAIGTSIVLGAGFERLRTSFEVIRKQTGFFSDAIHKLEKTVETVDERTEHFTHSINALEAKVSNVGEQANAFSQSMQKLEKKVDIVDKQTGFFSTALHALEKKVENIGEQEREPTEAVVEMPEHSEAALISTGKAEALVAHVEDLLTQMSVMASQLQEAKAPEMDQREEQHLSLPANLMHSVFQGGPAEREEIRYH